MGLSIAETMVELFSGLSPDNPLFEQYSFISADELPNVRLLLQRLGGKGVEAVPEADRAAPDDPAASATSRPAIAWA